MTTLYSFTTRFNYILYNMMAIMMICGGLNHLTVRFGHLIGLKDTKLGISEESIKFDLRTVD